MTEGNGLSLVSTGGELDQTKEDRDLTSIFWGEDGEERDAGVGDADPTHDGNG